MTLNVILDAILYLINDLSLLISPASVVRRSYPDCKSRAITSRPYLTQPKALLFSYLIEYISDQTTTYPKHFYEPTEVFSEKE